VTHSSPIKTTTATAIQNAINESSANDIIYLPAGTYRMEGGLTVLANRTLRGAGTSTILMGYGTGGTINAGSEPQASDYAWASVTRSFSTYADPQTNNTITAGLTANSETITIASTSAFSNGDLIQIAIENQDDNTKITNGSVILVGVAGYGALRRQMSRVISKTSTQLTIWPPVHYTPDDNLEARVHRQSVTTEGVGVEDLSIDQTNSNGYPVVQFQACVNSWIKGVEIVGHNNYGFKLDKSLNCEIRKSKVGAAKSQGGSNHAGILLNQAVNCLLEDNIALNNWPLIETNESTQGCVISHNFFYTTFAGADSIDHGAHPSLNLYEGNIFTATQQDGYFSSASENTFFRNWITGTRFTVTHNPPTAYRWSSTVALARFTRKFAFIGNIFNSPGWLEDAYSSPYNFGAAYGFTGSSTGVTQPTEGTFWSDWKITATLTTRTSASSGMLTLNKIGTLGSGNYPVYIYWGDGATERSNIDYVSHSGVTYTFNNAYPDLPAEGTTGITVFPGALGWEERDRDVFSTVDPDYPGSTYVKGNYFAWTGGGNAIPAEEALGGDTLPDSLIHSAKPSWFGSLTWPAFDPTSPGTLGQDGWVRIPAGYRYVNGNENYLSASGDVTISGTLTVNGTITLP
jgi:hypothetical protein